MTSHTSRTRRPRKQRSDNLFAFTMGAIPVLVWIGAAIVNDAKDIVLGGPPCALLSIVRPVCKVPTPAAFTGRDPIPAAGMPAVHRP